MFIFSIVMVINDAFKYISAPEPLLEIVFACFELIQSVPFICQIDCIEAICVCYSYY